MRAHSSLCVLKSPLLQTGEGMGGVGLGRGGRSEEVWGGCGGVVGRQRTWRQARINWQCNEMARCQVTMELPLFASLSVQSLKLN